jgi:hypothetical protein
MKFCGRPRKLTDAEIVEKYAELGDAITVGILAGCSPTTVAKIVRRAGGVVGPRGGRVTRPATLSVDEICRRYLEGESGHSIAQGAGTYAARIYKVLAAAGVPRRERGWHMARRSKHSSDS